MYTRLGTRSRGKLATERTQQAGYAGIFGVYPHLLQPTPESFALTIPRDKKYRVLKVTTSLPKFPTATDRELKIYGHLTQVNSPHPGQLLIRELYDSFDLQGPFGKHRCLMLQPMHMTLLEMMKLNPRPFDLPLLKMTVKRLLLALDFLHTEAEITHAGTQSYLDITPETHY